MFARSNLTRAQFLIWLGQQLTPDVPLYNMIQTFAFTGELDADRFVRAFQRVVDGTDALRTVIQQDDGVPFQRVLPALAFSVESVDLSAHADPQAAYALWLDQRRLRLSDLGTRLFDTALVRLAADRWVWYLSQHHLITDGFGFLNVYKRTAQMYERLANGQADLPAWPQFADYQKFERDFRATAGYAKAEAYWQNKTAAADPLAFFDKLSGQRGTRTERVVCDLGVERSAKLRAQAASRELRALSTDLALYNLFATLTAAYLHRATGRTQLAIGTPFHNRPTPAFKDTVGVFIEIGPLLVEVADDDTFLTLHKRVAREVQSSLANARPGVSRAELNRAYEVLLNFVNVQFPPFAGLAPEVEWVHAEAGDSAHSLRLQVADFGATGSFALHFDFNASVFTAQQQRWAIAQFLRVVDAFLAEPSRGVNAFSLQTEAERQGLVVEYNASAAPYPADQTIVQLFEAQVARTPHDEAIRFGAQSLTYAELNARANQMAAHLRPLGVGADQLVVLYMEHSIEVVVAVLGVLKAGGAYVPVDPANPKERLAFMLKDIEEGLGGAAPVLITQTRLANELPQSIARVITLDADFGAIAQSPITNPPVAASPHHLAYVIFTSGSTGKPKGVMIEHRSLVNYIWWANAQYAQGERLSWPLFSSLSFDLTVTSVFTPLIAGGRIVVYREDPGVRGMVIFQVVEDNAVDIVKLTPAHLAMIKDRNLRATRLRKFIVGGEDFKTELARDITHNFGWPVEIYNEYGPTEATVGCMIHRYDEARDTAPSVPIGVPAANAGVYVLDAHLNPAPSGVIGEMYLAGDGLARGYFNRPELTAERFVEPDSPTLPARLYRTGDIARWTADGRMEFLGRADHQVKISGARIELGEIEARLLQHPAVSECVVTVTQSTAAATPAEADYCARCGLASNFPGVSYDEAGVCNFCRAYDGYKDKAEAYFKTPSEFGALAAQMKAARTGDYDCVVLFSGGKDSAYMLYQVVSAGLKPLVFSLDNGFISDEARANIRRVVQSLGVDHVFGTTPHMRAIFVDSLKQYSNVCNGCFKTIYTLATNLAREKKIGYILTGLSRGQFFETRLTEDVFTAPAFTPELIDEAVLAARKAYHRRDDAISRSLDVDVFRDDALFDNIRFVDFYRYHQVPLDELYAFLREHAPWIRPSDTGRSTNCLINDLGIYLHKKQRGFHNYALPYSWDVRLGHKTRAQALEELNDEIDEARVRAMMAQIGYTEPAPLEERAVSRLAAYYVSAQPLTTAELRGHLAQALPEYMLPAYFIRLDALPLTPNGKVDRSALPQPGEQRPELAADYVAPRTPAERTLAEIWAGSLKLDRIGVHDNFFELGGDSILSLQIIARANKAGLALTPNQLFQHPTIAELATVARSAAPAAAVQGPATGEVPLTPIQHWFFEWNFTDAHHWNQTVHLEVVTPLDASLLREAFRHLLTRHDMLRAQYTRTASGWAQTVPAELPDDLVTELQVTELEASDEQARLLPYTLDLERGNLVRALLVSCGERQRLIMTIHHLAVDGVSWWVLLRDLETAYDQLARGAAVALPAGTAPFKRWAESLADYARSRANAHLPYWRAQTEAASPAIPLDQPASVTTEAGAQTLSASLTEAETRLLLREVSAAFRAQINETLLAALAQTLTRWAGRETLTIAMEGHGREELFAGLDVSRTVGWFTSVYPVTLPARADVVATLAAVKDAQRALPNHGVDYGVLRYLSRALPAAPMPSVLFNYLGQFETLLAEATRFRLARPLQLARAPSSQRPYALEINAHITGGCLQVDWTFSEALHHRETVRRLAADFVGHLRALIERRATAGVAALTPADFPDADLNADELQELLADFAEGARP
jgi:amino acid adenylation domain-containing protein/non-ribosomal peptide synthase protein (TIGR01720 family)